MEKESQSAIRNPQPPNPAKNGGAGGGDSKIQNWTVELHTHTSYSPDCLVTLEQLVAACRRKGIDRVAITDHNAIAGALAASIAPW